MQKRSLKQKCLAWMLSLAVAMTFIPLTAGFAFAADKTLDLSTVNQEGTGTYEGSSFFINLKAPWYDSTNKANLDVIGANGTNQIASVDVIKLPGVGGMSGEAYDVTYSSENWTEPGEYTITVTGNPDVIAKTKDEDNYYLSGTWTKKCKIVDAKDLAGASIELEYTSCDFDGKEHKPAVVSVTDALGNTVDPAYYTVDYPTDSMNAYIKVGTFDVTVTAVEGNEGGYVNTGTATIKIKDEVSFIATYSQNGMNGAKKPAKNFGKAKWGAMAKYNAFKWCYNKSKGNPDWTTEYYIPIEEILAEAGLGEVGHFNKKDVIDFWTNSDPERYFKVFPISDLLNYGYTADGQDLLAVFGGEYKIPGFLIMDTQDSSLSPMFGVGYSGPGATAEECPAGNMFPKPVSEIVLINMDIKGLDTSVKNATYTGKALKPAVTVKDGDVTVPVTAVYSNNTKAGKGTVKITAKADSEYYGTVTKTFTIAKAAQKITKVTPAAKMFKAKKKTKKLVKNYSFTLKAAGTGPVKATFKKANKAGASKITVAKTGKVTVKKGLKKGTYKVKVKATKAANANYKAAAKTVTIKIVVK